MNFRFSLKHTASEAEYLPELSEWQNLGGGDVNWTLGSIPQAVLSPPPKTSGYLYTDYVFIPNTQYTITFGYEITYNVASPPRTLEIVIFDGAYNPVFTHPEVWTSNSDGIGTVSISFTATENCEAIGIRALGGTSVYVNITSLEQTQNEPLYEITEPDGWKEATLKLGRDKDFYSLIEFFEGSFIFYGDNGVVNGGIHIIKAWERQGGPDVKIEIFIEFSPDDEDWYEVFAGQLDISLAEELPDNKIRIPIIRDDSWAKFYSRKDTPVNILSETDLDDQEVDEAEPIGLELISQKIRYLGEYTWQESVTYPDPFALWGMQLDWDTVVSDDLRKFNLPRVPIDVGTDPDLAINLVGLFEAPWNGDYRFESRIESARYDPDTDDWHSVSSDVFYYLQKIGEIVSSFDLKYTSTIETYGADQITIATIDKSIPLLKGEQIAIFGKRNRISHAVTVTTIFGENRLDWKIDVQLATTITITLSGEQVIDGVMTSGDRVLVKHQGDPIFNGIYVSSTGAWTRAADTDTSAEISNAAVYVLGGDTNIDTAWKQRQSEVIINVTPNTWEYTLPSDERFREYPGEEVTNFLRVTADTTYKNTETQGFLIHDAGAAIIDRYVGGNPFYSETFGSELTNSRQYEQAGCNWKYNLSKGLHLRGYSFEEKSFFISFMEWWKGVNPIFNLGLTYETLPGTSGGTSPVADFPSLSSFINIGTGDSWTLGAVPTVNITTTTTKFLRSPAYAFQVGIPYKVTATYIKNHIFGSGVTHDIALRVTDVAYAPLFEDVQDTTTGDSSGTLEIEFTPSSDAEYILLTAYDGASVSITITSFVISHVLPPTDSVDVIRVEERAHFYDENPSLYISNVRDISRKYDTEKIYNKISVGYEQWQAEEISGIDDPQTRHTYATRLQKVGTSLELYSSFIAASLAIEQTRRQSIDKSSDYRFDDNVFIIAVTYDQASPDRYSPEFSENFSAINNLTNPDFRYNLKLTPARNFLRNRDWINGGLQSYLNSFYKFTSGEGNYKFESTLETDCEEYDGVLLSEKGSIPVTDNYIHTANYYELNVPMGLMQYLTIRENRKKAIGISRTDGDHVPFFIDELEYKLVKGTAKIQGWTKGFLDLSVVEGPAPTQDCTITEMCLNAITDEYEEMLTDNNGVCITA